MADFNPDQYLAEKTAAGQSAQSASFDPDKYLAEKGVPPEDFIDKAAGYLPAIGGVVGGIAGIPADIPTLGGSTIAGAGAGAAGGEALKNLIHQYRHPEQKDDSSAMGDLWEGAKSAAGQAVGEKVIAPVLSPLVEKYGAPVAKYLSDKMGSFAAKQMSRATGMSGASVVNAGLTPEQVGRTVLDRGLGGFGDTQGQIAEKAAAALKSSGEALESTIGKLEEKGAQVDRNTVIDMIKKKISELSGRESQTGLVKQLKNEVANIEAQISTETAAVTPPKVISEELPKAFPENPEGMNFGRQKQVLRDMDKSNLHIANDASYDPYAPLPEVEHSTMPLGASEAEKTGYANKVNYRPGFNATENDANGIVAGAYRQAGEGAAAGVGDPALSAEFLANKEAYGAIKPIADSTGKRAVALAQKQGPNMHALGSMGLGGLAGGEEGYRHGGVLGGLAGAAAGAAIGARAPSSIAAGADALSKFIASTPSLAPQALGAATQVAGREIATQPPSADKLSDIVQRSPQSLGQWAPALQAAAQRGPTSLAATSAVLQQTDSAYRAHMKKLFDGSNQ